MFQPTNLVNAASWQRNAPTTTPVVAYAPQGYGLGTRMLTEASLTANTQAAPKQPTVTFQLPSVTLNSMEPRIKLPIVSTFGQVNRNVNTRRNYVMDAGASPTALRMSFVTNRSSYMSPVGSPVECSFATTALDFLLPVFRESEADILEDDVLFPVVPGQRLIVKSCAALRLRESKNDPQNVIVTHLEEGELVYFLKAGKDGNRIKVQSVSTNYIGWVSWKVEDSGHRIFAIQPREV